MPGNIKGMRKPRSLKAGVLIRQGTKKALRRNPEGFFIISGTKKSNKDSCYQCGTNRARYDRAHCMH